MTAATTPRKGAEGQSQDYRAVSFTSDHPGNSWLATTAAGKLLLAGFQY
jgi:hypothetical protein